MKKEKKRGTNFIYQKREEKTYEMENQEERRRNKKKQQKVKKISKLKNT